MPLKNDLAYNALVAKSHLLSPQEKFFIVESLKACKENIAVRADLYLQCGFTEKAKELFEENGDWRGVGKCHLSLGNEDKALEYFLKPAKGKKEKGCSRFGADYDLIIKLLFSRKDWASIVKNFKDAKIFYVKGNLIVLRGVAVNSKPWLRILSIAMSKHPESLDDLDWQEDIQKAFNISSDEFQKTLNWATSISDEELENEIKNSVSFLFVPKKSYEEIIEIGKTERSEKLLKWIIKTSSDLQNIREATKIWLNSGNKEALKYAVASITGSGIRSMMESVFFEVSHRTLRLDGPADRVIQFYKSHDDLFRYCFPHCMELQIKNGGQISVEDLLTSVFQYITFWGAQDESDEDEEIAFSITQLSNFDDWALIKLEEWKSTIGEKLSSKSEKDILKKKNDEDIRKLPSWKAMSKEATWWLSAEWKKEISNSRWISENKLHSIIKRKFLKHEVVQHASPAWLSPQHLDIYVPELALAIEYMGIQHYEPVDIFGGEEGYIKTVERDKKKQEICSRAGIKLFYVRYDQDAALAVQEIALEYIQKEGQVLINKSKKG